MRVFRMPYSTRDDEKMIDFLNLKTLNNDEIDTFDIDG